MYVTGLEMIDRFDAQEMARVAGPQSLPRFEGELLRAVITGQPTTDWPADEVQAAEAALGRIDEAIADAGQQIDGYLGKRYPLPIVPAPTLLKRLAASIARFLLHDDAATDEIRKRYEDSVRTLQAIAKGEMSLGLDDPSPARGAGAVGTKTRRDRVFSRDSLADY